MEKVSSRSSRGSRSGGGTPQSYQEKLLNQLIRDEREYPLTASEFRTFLKTRFSDENFDFLQEYYQLTEAKTDVVEDAAKYDAKIKHLMETYIVPGGERELNIPGPLRDSSIASFKKLESNYIANSSDISAIFGPAANETRNLLITQKLVYQFEERMLQNMSDSMVRQRKLILLLFSLLSILIVAITILFEASRWIRLLTALTNLCAGFAFISAYGKVCPMCAWNGVRYEKADKMNSNAKQMKDAFFREYVQLKVNERLRLSFVITALITALMVAMPESVRKF